MLKLVQSPVKGNEGVKVLEYEYGRALRPGKALIDRIANCHAGFDVSGGEATLLVTAGLGDFGESY